MAPIRVRLEPRGVELDVLGGERLLDVADDHPELGLPAACRAGNCGVCLLRVLQGAGALSEPAAGEQRALVELGAASDERLGCQVRLRADLSADTGLIVLALGRA
jgi:ferredoxin